MAAKSHDTTVQGVLQAAAVSAQVDLLKEEGNVYAHYPVHVPKIILLHFILASHSTSALPQKRNIYSTHFTRLPWSLTKPRFMRLLLKMGRQGMNAP